MADNKYRSLNFNHAEINALLEKIQKGFVLTEKEYNTLFNVIGLENISTFDGDYESLDNKPVIPTALGQLENDIKLQDENAVNAKMQQVTEKVMEKVNEGLSDKAEIQHIESLKIVTDDLQKQVEKKINIKEGYDLMPEDEIKRLSEVDNYDDSELKKLLEEKADKSELFSKDYNDLENKPEIPSIEGLATEQYVGQLISDLIDFAPDAMNTLGEISKAIEEHQEIYDVFVAKQQEELDKKVDKVEGMSLMDDKEIERLSKVDNFDASELWDMFEVDEPYTSKPNSNGKLYLFACGYPVLIEGKENGGVKVQYAFRGEVRGFDFSKEEADKLIVVGGFGERHTEFRHILPSTNIHVKNATIYGVHGANYHEGNVGVVNVLIENSNVRDIMGGGDSGKTINGEGALRNIVGETNVVLNNVKNVSVAYAGGSGHCTVSKCCLEINEGCEVNYAIAGGANGYVRQSKMIINGGEVKVAQSVNRGIVERFEIEMNGGVVKKFYFGGESGDDTVNGIFMEGSIKLNAGEIANLYCGTNNGIEMSKQEMKGVIRNTKVNQGDVSSLDKIQMPADPKFGDCIFDAESNKPLWFNGSNWVDASGKIVG